jgi:hypothetical protein
MTVFMVYEARVQSFWYDELCYTIGIIAGKSIAEITSLLLKIAAHLPLYFWTESVIYDIMPYGEVYILLPSIICVVFGVIILGAAAKKLFDDELKYLVICIAATSSSLMIHCGWELRPYGMFFCFSSLTIFSYVNRFTNFSGKSIALYSFSVLLLVFTHWFGVLLIFFYGLTDILLCCCRKLKFSTVVLSYITPLFLLSIWTLLCIKNTPYSFAAFWIPTPTIDTLFAYSEELLSNNKLLCLLFAFTICFLLQQFIYDIRRKRISFQNFIWLQQFFCIVWIIGIAFVYSKFINPRGSAFLFRYFVGVVPHAILISGFGLYIANSICKTLKFNSSDIRFVPLLLCLAFIICGYDSYKKAYLSQKFPREPYRQAAKSLAHDPNIFAHDTLMIIQSNDPYIADAWTEYYFKKAGTKKWGQIPSNIAIFGPARKNRQGYWGRDSPLVLRIADGNVVSPRILNSRDLLKFKYIYIFGIPTSAYNLSLANLRSTLASYDLIKNKNAYCMVFKKRS